MSDSGYYRFPTIHKDQIVFSCEDDLWSVPADGGIARRLTASAGEASHPRFSPDGKMLAFVSHEEGHLEVFVMPSQGGEARRLTYMGSTFCQAATWSPDGEDVLFVSDAGTPFSKAPEGLAVSHEGGMPRRLKLGHMRTIHMSPRGVTVIGRNASDPARWKRYHGGTAGEIWIDPSGDGKFRPLINVDGNAVCPLIIGQRVYFLSDHEGIGNVYSCTFDGRDLTAHTGHKDYYVRYPSTDGRRIVYTAGARIYVFDPATGKTTNPDIRVPCQPTQSIRRFVDSSLWLESVSPGPKSDALAFVSRGQPFTMPFWDGAVIKHARGNDTRYRLPAWLHDGERFVVVSDEPGFERLEVRRHDQSTPPQPLTTKDLGRVIELAASPASDLVALANHRHELYLVDVKKATQKRLDHAPGGRITGLAWSACGTWLAYSWPMQTNVQIIRVVDLSTGEIHDVTAPVACDWSPAFDPEGKYIYFLSNRELYPVYDAVQFDLSFPQATRPYLATLRADVSSPFASQAKPLVGRNLDKRSTGNTDGKTSTARKLNIDFDGIEGRIVAFPLEEGRYVALTAAKGRILTTRLPLKGIRRDETFWSREFEPTTLQMYDIEERRSITLQTDVRQISLAGDFRTLAVQTKDRVRVIDALMPLPEKDPPAPGWEFNHKTGWVDIGRAKVEVNPGREWLQIYREAWRLQKDHFWDEQMAGVDWDLVYDRYATLVPLVRSRSELSDLIWEMQGELGTSHAYEFGGDYRQAPYYPKGSLGAELSFDAKTGGYRIVQILRGDSWDREADSPLAEPGLDIRPGDVITAVDGEPVSERITVDELLLNRAGKEILLTITSKREKRAQVTVRALSNERWLRYRHWVEGNRRYVHEKSKGRLGYVHIPDMGPYGFAEFHRSYLPEINREGLVVDVRFNGGGHVSSLILQRLCRKRVGYDVSRWGKPEPYPQESVAGPMVAITNQFAGSDGDIFSHCFKLYKLGPLVGKRTWGGVIGIWPRHRLVDGTVTTQPEFSFWFVDVGWGVENYGTAPDLEVDIAPQDYQQGSDPQLEAAVKLALDSLKREPVTLPDFSSRPSLPIPGSRRKAASRRK